MIILFYNAILVCKINTYICQIIIFTLSVIYLYEYLTQKKMHERFPSDILITPKLRRSSSNRALTFL